MSRHVNVAVRETRVHARVTVDALSGDQRIKRENQFSKASYLRSFSSGRKRA